MRDDGIRDTDFIEPPHPRLLEAQGLGPARSRGGVIAFTLLLLVASSVWVPATPDARRADGGEALHAPAREDAAGWVLLLTALDRRPYVAHAGGEDGPVLEKGTVGWRIDWFLLGTIWVIIVALGGALGLLFRPAGRSDRGRMPKGRM